MKKLALLLVLSVAAIGLARASDNSELNPLPRHHPTKNQAARAAGTTGNLLYHSPGPVIHSAHVVSIFWGPSWSTGGSDSGNASHIVGFFNQFGTSGEYNTIAQYGDTTGRIQTTSLGNTAWHDSTTPPRNATDAVIQGEVNRYLARAGVTFDSSAIYEVFLPATSYSSDGTSTSCGGPNLAYCAYHSHYSSASHSDIKYASMPYPSCGGCQHAGWSTAQNFDHFAGHETREAVTDENANAWFDSAGNEADDKCAWTGLFTANGYGYQPEWSNAANGCVAHTP